MLTLTEKLYAKILANHIKELTRKVIDQQQTRFLVGRNILDNLLTYRLIQELVTRTKQETTLLKADFMKAYDKVEYTFIWHIMTTLGFAPYLIKLAKGLVENVESKVHINGWFTRSIMLEWGVRQGCPLSVLLFTISTQAFMLMLKEQADLGNIEGVQLGNGEQLTHQLFAKNTGILFKLVFKATKEKFWNVREVNNCKIQSYLRIGACLNLSKSIFIPLYLNGPIPRWMLNAGCKIAQ